MRHPRPDYVPEGHVYVPIEFRVPRRLSVAALVLRSTALAILAVLIILPLIFVLADPEPEPTAPVPSRNPARPPATEGVR